MMIYGYARCSTNEDKQDIQRQVRELKQAGAEQVFLEYEHGDSVIKEQLAALMDEAGAGDTILTLEVSRLARSTKQLCDIIERVREKHLRLSIVSSIQVDCSNGELDPMTNAFIQMSACLRNWNCVSSASVCGRECGTRRRRGRKLADHRPRLTIFPQTSSAIIPHTKTGCST